MTFSSVFPEHKYCSPYVHHQHLLINQGLPPLPSLQRLDLSENRISGNLDHLLCCPHIEYLNLAGNKISALEVLEPLKNLEELRSLDLFGCELATSDDYRKNVFEVSLFFLKCVTWFNFYCSLR